MAVRIKSQSLPSIYARLNLGEICMVDMLAIWLPKWQTQCGLRGVDTNKTRTSIKKKGPAGQTCRHYALLTELSQNNVGRGFEVIAWWYTKKKALLVFISGIDERITAIKQQAIKPDTSWRQQRPPCPLVIIALVRLKMLQCSNNFLIGCALKNTLPWISRVGLWKAFVTVCYKIDMVRKML